MLVNMRDILLLAKAGGYGVGFFNAVNVEMARAVIEAAEELRAPVMVGTAQILLPVMELEQVAQYLIPMARKASVPVCVHYDHGLTFARCMEALKLGFSSVMYDCSMAPYEENVENVAQMVKICHAVGATVEGELGHVGDNAGAGRLANPSDFFTQPDIAEDFVQRTKIDALAVAVGNAHGEYAFAPKLDFGRIEEISRRTGIPLVLHGGSGTPQDKVAEAVNYGIAKVNICTEFIEAFALGIEEGREKPDFSYNVENLFVSGRRKAEQLVESKIKLFSNGKNSGLV